MKHLFLVHTPITLLSSVAVIAELKIPKENAIIIFHSFYNADLLKNENFTGVNYFDHIKNINFIKRIGNYFRYFNINASLDELVNEIIGQQKFIAYVPVLTSIHKFLITHKNCISFSFIEEGLAQYYNDETLESINPVYNKYSWRSSIIKNTKQVLNELYLTLKGYNFKLQALPFSYSCYQAIETVRYYGFSNEAFPLINNNKKHILSFKNKSFETLHSDNETNLSNQYLWIGDPGTVHYGFDKRVYLNGIKEGCIPFLKTRNIKKIFIKFHRDEPVSLQKEIEELFSNNNISATVIPVTTIMELLLSRSKNAIVIGVYSSLLYYAAIMGHQSYSIFNFVKHEYSKAIANRDFSFFWSKVQLI